MPTLKAFARRLAVVMTLLPVPDGAIAAQGIDTITAACAGCHGERGVSQNPLVPTLAGQPYSLIEDNLLAFRAGNRACAAERDDGSPSALLARTMCASVAELTDAEITALAEYFEQQDFVPAGQDYDSSLAEGGERLHAEKGCEACHADGGRTTQAMAPVLAGQWTEYLRRAMNALKAGTKQGPEVMNAAIQELDEQDVEALLNFYASRPRSE